MPRDWKKIFEISALWAGVLALVVGVYHVIEIDRATEKIRGVERALSTRSIPEFNDALLEMIDVISSAEKEVFVVCDVPAYYDYTNEKLAVRLQNVIREKIAEKKTVHLVFLRKDSRSRWLTLEFPEANWPSLKQDPKVLAYIKRHPPNPPPQDPLSPTHADFIRSLERSDQEALDLYRGAEIKEVDDLPVFCWVGDHRAVFAIASFHLNIDDRAFKTSDENLIDALRAMAKHYDG